MLSDLLLKDFRSYSAASFIFQPLTTIIGANGSGKTSLIEAIRLLSVGKSFRTSRVDEVIRFDQPYFQLQASWNDAKLDFFYGVQFSENPVKERRLQVNGKEDHYIDYIGKFPTVIFTPEHLEIILGAPSERRKYFDSVLWQINREFRQAHMELQRVLRERSALLFMIKTRRAKIDELEPWTELLREKTKIVRAGREQFQTFINENIQKESLSRADLPFQLAMKPAFNETDDLIFQEVESAQNLIGAHRDELEVVFRDRQARKFASRGQARTIIAAVKVIEADFLSQFGSAKPVILLDDILSELDLKNAEYSVNNFIESYQVITTSITPSKQFSEWHTIEVENDSRETE